jgi:endonuclease G
MKIPLEIVNGSEDRYRLLLRSEVAEEANESIHPDLSSDRKDSQGKLQPIQDVIDSRRLMLNDVSNEPIDFALERTVGSNDSVYSNFIDLIQQAKQPVGRITVRVGRKVLGYATGFMVSSSLMLTSHHVFKIPTEARESTIEFFYEYDADGNKPVSVHTFGFDPDKFFYSNASLDYCLLFVHETDVKGSVRLADIGYLPLNPFFGKLGEPNGKEALNIIHHPNGDFKQLSIRENRFTHITEKTIWYTSDTAKGSSGSPVFNDQFQLVALHHSGVPKRDKKGRYIDRDGKAFVPKQDLDEARVVWIANEGIRISVLVDDFLKNNPDNHFVAELKETLSNRRNCLVLPTTEKNSVTASRLKKSYSISDSDSSGTGSGINIFLPASLLEGGRYLNLQIDEKDSSRNISPTGFVKENIADLQSFDFEIKKREKEADFSLCNGYNQDFLGRSNRIGLPLPTGRPSS